MEYYPRYIENEIERKLRSSGAVAVEGPKFSGKTTTCLRYAESSIRLNTGSMIGLARIEPRNILFGKQPRLVDEWQTVPDIWNEIRGWIDENPGFGQFILTGSSTPVDKNEIYHSGAGRISKVRMYPMSLFESRDSKGAYSLSDLFENPCLNIFDCNEDWSLHDTAYVLCRGGWPLSVLAPCDTALDVTNNYYEGLFEFEYSENGKFRNKKSEVMRELVRSYARNISSQASVQTIRQDIAERNTRTLDPRTIDDYLDCLKDLFIIEDMEAWTPNIRSKAAIRTTPTRHFVDTSLAVSSLGLSPENLFGDLPSFGLFFEDMAVRDLRIYARFMGGKVYHYRDSSGLECDCVITLPDGRWGAVEIKLGEEKNIEEGARNLLKLEDIMEEGRKPSFLMVLTATGPSYRRNDGVCVMPVNLLRA